MLNFPKFVGFDNVNKRNGSPGQQCFHAVDIWSAARQTASVTSKQMDLLVFAGWFYHDVATATIGVSYRRVEVRTATKKKTRSFGNREFWVVLVKSWYNWHGTRDPQDWSKTLLKGWWITDWAQTKNEQTRSGVSIRKTDCFPSTPGALRPPSQPVCKGLHRLWAVKRTNQNLV